MILFIYIFVILSAVTQIKPQSSPSDTELTVRGIRKEYYIFLNETYCIVSEYVPSQPSNSYFTTTDIIILTQQTCDFSVQLQVLHVNIPESVTANWSPAFVDNEGNFVNRVCWSDDIRCEILIDFKIKRITTPAPSNQNETINNSAAQNDDKLNPNIFVYVGIGGGIVLLVVIIQTVCIVAYSRKVVSTRHALESVLHKRDEKRVENDRYSVGPVAKKYTTNTTIVATAKTTAEKDIEDDLYESLENLARADPQDGVAMKSYNVKDRPPLPLPHEVPSLGRKDDGETLRLKLLKDRPRLPVPQEEAPSRYCVQTLPLKPTSQKQSTPLMVPLINGNMTTPRLRPVVPPKKLTNSHVMNELNNVLGRNQNQITSPSSNPNDMRPLLNRMTSATSIPRQTENTPLRQYPLNHVDKTRTERCNSSDDEWTYEKLPPITKYLR